ncbi:MAG: P-loop NTPase [Clostridiales bacterium]|nr:P-loop NTPase [Clostridiales bacterium]
MAEKETRAASRPASTASGGLSQTLDLDSMLRDICRQWWVILLAAAAAALLAGGVVQLTYTPQYTTTAIFVVSKSGVSGNTVSDSISASSALAETFTTVVDSDILETRVCRALGVDSLDGDISISVVSSTSLMTMTVNASSPRLAYEMIQAVMDTAVELCREVSDNITIQMLQSPEIPVSASNTLKVYRPMISAGVIALVLMALLFGTLSYFRDTAKTEWDLRRKVDAKLLASIPHEQKYKTLSARVHRKSYSLFLENPTLSFGYVEACRMMGTRVRRELDRKGGRVLMVSSVSENEGKSTVAANLAMALVQEGRSAVLVDCDFRKPAQYKILGLPKEREEECDLGTALKKRGAVQIQPMGMEKNLPVLFSTTSHRRLLTREVTEAMGMTIDMLKKMADYIILDTSPLGLVAESARIASLADASLLVVEQDVVEVCFLNDAIDQLNESGAKVLGCVFNNVHTGLFGRASTYGSYYGYGHSYGYGHYGYGHYDKAHRTDEKAKTEGRKS